MFGLLLDELLRINPEILNIRLGSDPVIIYPCEYFSSKKTKPPMTWYEVDESKVNILRGSIVTSFSQGSSIDLEHVYAYLCYVGQRMSNSSKKEWKSYGQIICSPNQLISVKDIFHIEKTKIVPIEGVVGENISVTEADDIWIVLIIFTTWQLSRMRSRPDHWFNKKVNRQLKKFVPKQLTITREKLLKNYFWQEKEILGKLGAAFDMYLRYFKNDKMRIIRFASERSRYKDCIVLKDIDFMWKKLGLENLDQLYDWILAQSLQKEVDRLKKPDEGKNDKYGYFPYMMDLLGLNRSPYSAKVNPGLHVFLNMLGAGLNLERCSNRKMLNDKVLIFEIKHNVACLLWAFGSHPSTDPNLPPITRSASEFKRWLNKHNSRIPSEIVKYASEKFHANKLARPGSIACFAKKLFPCT